MPILKSIAKTLLPRAWEEKFGLTNPTEPRFGEVLKYLPEAWEETVL